jgi:NAD(P)-dependent dehydrogenase (short-subunit alcohol dehydrogenase family)
MITAITGGAGALGSTLAKVLVSKGQQVVLLDMVRSKDRLDALVKELGGPNKATSFASDFSDAAAWSAALDQTKSALGGLPTCAALIAGGWAGGEPVHASKDESSYARMMTSNVDSTYRALRALLPSMVAAKQGSIVVIGSRAVERPWTSGGSAAYAASKSAVVTLARTVAEEVLDHGVRVNAVLPSTMDTPANRSAMPNEDPSKWVSLPSAAGVIAFLLSDEARDVSGAVLPIYGRA